MSDQTKVEWATSTWNPVTGCTPVSEGCQHCYARRMAKRLAGRCGYPAGDGFAVTMHEDKLWQPAIWRITRRIFVCSMGDLFHEDITYEQQRKIYLHMLTAPQHDYIILTKRPERMAAFTEAMEKERDGTPVWGDSNFWIGVTAENQARADERIPILLDIPAFIHWVSFEPLLGPVDLNWNWLMSKKTVEKSSEISAYLDWIVVGAETGPGARSMELGWALKLRSQARCSETPFFFKKNSLGRHDLYGDTHEQYPETERDWVATGWRKR
jgi:protein gp37